MTPSAYDMIARILAGTGLKPADCLAVCASIAIVLALAVVMGYFNKKA